ncbi:hypothetical protein [Alistipes sp.]
MTAARTRRKPGYRRVGYLEQVYYILKWWTKRHRRGRQEGAKT